MKMIEHKHAELLRAIADCEDIQISHGGLGVNWCDESYDKIFELISQKSNTVWIWRIKPEKKPDFTEFLAAEVNEEGRFYVVFHNKDYPTCIPNLRLTFNGETRKLIKSEIIE